MISYVKLSPLKFSDRTFYILLNDQQCVARIVAVVFTFPPSLPPTSPPLSLPPFPPSLAPSVPPFLPNCLPTYLSTYLPITLTTRNCGTLIDTNLKKLALIKTKSFF